MPTRPVMTVEELQHLLDNAFPGNRVPYVIEQITDSSVRMVLRVGETDGRPGGTVSGPTLMALADCAAWMVIIGQIGPVTLSVTTSFHIDFLRKPELVDIVAVGGLLKLGSRLAVAEVAMYSVGNEDIVAKAQVTYSIPPH
jgi:acyl-coenzyme A thioesterase PaaI-like protein